MTTERRMPETSGMVSEVTGEFSHYTLGPFGNRIIAAPGGRLGVIPWPGRLPPIPVDVWALPALSQNERAAVVEKARAIIKTALAELYPDDLVFDPIEIEIATYHDDDEYLKIHIVFEGDSEKITPDLSGDLIRHIRPQLAELGFPGVPCWSFVSKSEWVKYFQSERVESARTD